MQILTAAEIRAWDAFTIEKDSIASIQLMERAARACTEWIIASEYSGEEFHIYCGKGNNGGDGLAIARMLFDSGNQVSVFIADSVSPGTTDFQINLQKLRERHLPLQFITDSLPVVPDGTIIIDALLGTGLNRPVDGRMAAVVQSINHSANPVISIDIPSGLSSDEHTPGNNVIRATHTLSFQHLKPAFIVAANEKFVGTLHLLHIGLHPDFPALIHPAFTWVTAHLARKYFRPRTRFAHKGTYGHALLIAGRSGSMGAAVLAAKAVLAGGAGLLTVMVPRSGNVILQTAVPEAMTITDNNDAYISEIPVNTDRFQAIGAGPGLGTEKATASMLQRLFGQYARPLVLDADALNLLAQHPQLLTAVPPNTVLTPHPKEFDRLFGTSENDFARIRKAKQMSIQNNVVIVLKGHHTCIFSGNECYVNSTGNAGMAKGGSGDVLTGFITALLAQGYDPTTAAVLGVYLHGKAGDIALAATSYESMLPSDLLQSMGAAFRSIYR